MKFLVISDSHGSTDVLEIVLRRHQGKIDYWLHCGDSELSHDSDEMNKFYAVGGNCDLDSNYHKDQLLELDGLKILLTHGHLYNINMTPINLMYKAQEGGAQLVCFGHTHLAGSEQNDELIFLNPGSIRFPRDSYGGTYAICEWIPESSKLNINFYTLEGEKVDAIAAVYDM